MTEKKRWQAKEWVFLVWFMIAIAQINYSIYLMFFSTIGTFFFWNGICMLVEGAFGILAVYGE